APDLLPCPGPLLHRDDRADHPQLLPDRPRLRLRQHLLGGLRRDRAGARPAAPGAALGRDVRPVAHRGVHRHQHPAGRDRLRRGPAAL
ncbi:MAG: Cell division integral membrane protein, YggT and half-length relatives, partial [uncultured Acidimicrobiales bacterium]